MKKELFDFLNAYILEKLYKVSPVAYIWGPKGSGKSHALDEYSKKACKSDV